MNGVDYLLVAVSLIVFVRGVITLTHLLQSLHWLARSTENGSIVKVPRESPQIHILIPALREQGRIIETLTYFLNHVVRDYKNADVIVVTTQREFEKKFSGPSTYQLIKNFIESHKLANVRILDSPNRTGIRADQLNHALETMDDDSYIAVYDADSRPHPNTLRVFYAQLAQTPHAKVFQQPAVFFNNYPKLRSLFLRASAVLQSRWTLAHEIPRLRRQSRSVSGVLHKYSYAHVVGHGLIIDTKLLKQVGGFPAQTLTEDLFLGYLLRAKGYSIYPLPVLELSDAPTTLKGLWNQKYVWFFGPLNMIAYLRFTLRNRAELQITDRAIPWMMTFQGLVSTVAWAVSGILVSILIVAPLFTQQPMLISFAWLSVFLYGPLQHYITLTNFGKLHAYAGAAATRLSSSEVVVASVMSLPAILFHSIPPYAALVTSLQLAFSKQAIYKPKTDD